MKTTRKNERRSDCPVSFGLDIFGDKWTLLILRDIMFYNRTRFSDFAPQEHIATNILADRLSRLEDAGIIKKHRDEVLKNQYVYTVAQKGKDLLPVLIEMTLWGFQYDAKTPASKVFVERIKTDKRKLGSGMAQSISRGTFLQYRQNKIGI
ncbi:MAG TPA: helix-turn-helix domain-containing protein [Patescibacteria group bacterium]|nr:helix-turn-helix domain-containing protein [Patescibacteria group bacterium]